MPKKRIVICADGTWNQPEKDIESDFPTNVLKCARGIKPLPRNGIPQTVFYDWGVGADRKKVAGGLFGIGINKNVKDCYRFIVQNYTRGDEIFLFGFSRGAYTVRSLSGFLNNCGILKREHANRVHEAFEFYKGARHRPSSKRAQKFRDDFGHSKRGPVKFIGVWDTVGALGIPLGIFKGLNKRHQFHDNELGSNVKIGRQALAIDEKRKDFVPTIWKPKAQIDIEQVWFSGCHADVGGSTKPDNGGALLSDIPFQWVLGEAMKAGLVVERHMVRALHPSAFAATHESRGGFWRARPKKTREIPVAHPLSNSVRQRHKSFPGYRPVPLIEYLAKVDWNNVVKVKKPVVVA